MVRSVGSGGLQCVCVNGCTFILFVFLRVFVCVLFALGKKKKGGKRIVEKEICESSKS